ncbi:hypothetical protein CIK05_09370 [Bdellovibrio sp. qaytius]|nr:hypothetical protein CIK05_09370 [Bdellovibrio sp. qaytius]
MELASSIYRPNLVTCKIIAMSFAVFFALITLAQPALAVDAKNSFCKSSNLALESARELYGRGQYLLSLQEFSIAEKFDCSETLEQAQWGYLLAVTELGEKNEMFHLSHKVYPRKFSLGNQQKLKLYQSYYFPKADGTAESGRVESFTEWKNNLPLKKSPTVAGTLSAFIPGAGQAYTGSWQSGAMAFVLNALFLSATLDLVDHDLHAAALASGVVFSITYLGNILNAAESARVYNQNYYAPAIEAEKAKRFPELTL